jgi:asparagine synthase (glutamine-hydrolysing)
MRAVLRFLSKKRAHRPRRNVTLLDPDISRSVVFAPHPWTVEPSDGRPGKQAHIASILEAIHFSEYLNLRDSRPTICPLLSQPIVECCSTLPTWRWFENGEDRSLARRSFAVDLPPEVLARRIKGTFKPLVEQTFFRRIDQIRAMVLEGRLSQEKIIDRRACEKLLFAPQVLDDVHLSRLLDFIDVEAWLQAQH